MHEPAFGTFTTDRELRILQWDRWMAAASGIGADEAEGALLYQLMPDLVERGLVDRFLDVIDHGTVSLLSPRLHRYLIPCPAPPDASNYSQMQQRVTILPLRGDAEIRGTLVTVEDVTLRLERENQLSQQMESSSDAVRLETVTALAEETTDGDFSPALFGALDDSNWQVRWVATENVQIQSPGDDTLHLVLDALRSRHQDLGILNSIIKVLAKSQVNVVRSLVHLLETTDDTDLHIYIALILGELRDPDAVQALIKLLAGPDQNVVYHAIESLGKLRAAEATLALTRFVIQGDFFLGFVALESLGRIGDSRAVPAVAAALDDEMMGVAAVETLGNIGHPDGVLSLVSLLESRPEWTEPVIAALVGIYTKQVDNYGNRDFVARLVQLEVSPQAQDSLLKLLPTATGDFLRNLIIVLGWLEGQGVEETLVALIQKPEARREVIEALSRHGPHVARMLVRILHSGNLESRLATIQALGRIGDPGALPALVDVMRQDERLAIAAATALGQIGDIRAFRPLLEGLRTPSRPVRQALIGAINSLGHPDMARHITQALGDPDPHLREGAVRIASYFAFPESFAGVLACTQDENEDVCEAALEGVALFEKEGERALGALTHGLARSAHRLRAAAARGLAHISPRRAWPLLLAALDDPAMWVRYYTVRSIGQLQVPDATDLLIEKLEVEEAPPVRVAILDALGEIGGSHSIAALARFVHCDDDDMARAALTSLGALSHPNALAPILDVLESPHGARRLLAIESLSHWDAEEVVPNLSRMLAPTVPEAERMAALHSLAALPKPTAVHVLIESTGDGFLREAALSALASVEMELLPVVEEGLTHPNPTVRQAVAASLARHRHPLATKALARHLSTDDEELRSTVAQALEQSTLLSMADVRRELRWQV